MASVATAKPVNPLPTTTKAPSPKLANGSAGKKKDDVVVDAKPADKKEDDKTNAPLAPPPKPGQPDYFGNTHSAHFSLEPNPFEQSFGNSSTDTPSRFGGLPSVQSLTSPAPLGPGATPDWQNSLRSGPLSPAMLTGPTTANGDYFDSTFRQSFPTPNESSLRSTGLTPGGPSMFPAPSPNSQAIFNSMQSGGATPGTLDFHRTAMSAAARSKTETQPQNSTAKQDYQPAASSMAFNNSNSESDAVNSLFMLANNGQRNTNQFVAQPNHAAAAAQMRAKQEPGRGHQQSISALSGSAAGNSDNGDVYGSDSDNKPGKRSKRATKAGNGRRKADEVPVKANKKSKGNNGMAMSPPSDDEEDDMGSGNEDMEMSGGKKLTDEEKRKNFLERNRVAALKCRQRKKQWLANLQAKVEIFTTENEALTNQCAQLREENSNLKALLMQHKDCPVSHSQGLGGARMAQVLGADFEQNSGPYAMMGSNQMMMGQAHAGQGQR